VSEPAKTVREVTPLPGGAAGAAPLRRREGDTRRLPPVETADPSPPLTVRLTGAAAPAPEVKLPRRVGRYEIVRELGRGGMGVVYHARDPKLKRDVALKMVLAGSFAAVDQLARFYAEAEAVARLKHPHIVQIYEIGDHDGKPFVALEFLDGGTLRERCAGHPQPPRAAATVVHALAQAMAYAHAAGVIHRDLKPANVLLSGVRNQESGVRRQGPVTPAPCPQTPDSCPLTPKITDFGLAKFDLDVATTRRDSGQTRTGEVLGTPQYMAPEQARGRPGAVGPAADIYSLGAILYELMTGRPPFDGPTPMDTLLRLATEDVLAPSRLVGSDPRVCPRDLETICLKCLQKEPAKRYGFAQALADDLARFLNGEPIRARPVGRVEWAVKWARRRPAVAVLLALLTLVVGGSLVVTTMLWQRAERRGVQARQRFQLARDAVDQMLTEVGQEYLKNAPHMTAVRQRLLEQALAFYHKFLAEQGDDPDLRAETGRAYQRVGDVYAMMGRQDEAEQAYRAAETIQAKLADTGPAVSAHRRDLARTRHRLGNLLRDTARLPDAEQMYRRAIDAQEQQAKAQPAFTPARLDLAQTHHDLGCLLDDLGRTAEAEKVHHQALELFNGLAAAAPDSPEVRYGRARSLGELARLARMAGRYDESEKGYAKVLAAFEQLAAEHPLVPDYRYKLAVAQQNLAWLMAHTRRPDEAEALCQNGLTIGTRLMADFPAVPEYPALVATLHNMRAVAFYEAQRHNEAEAACRQALALRHQLVVAHPANPEFRRAEAECQQNLSALLLETGRPKEAEPSLRTTIAQRQKLAGDFPKVPAYLIHLGDSYAPLVMLLLKQGRQAEALGLLEEEVPVWERLVAAGDAKALPVLADRLGKLGALLEESGRAADALSRRRQALALYEKLVADGGENDKRLRSLLEEFQKLVEAESIRR
jgi:serine/threonine protein kinase/tetratricopeptide (TPR) repeat protein